MPRLRVMQLGNGCLKCFAISLTLLLIVFLCNIDSIIAHPLPWIIIGIIAAVIEFILFCVGIATVYMTSVQLGIKWRVLGAVFGWIPVLHLIMLAKIITTVSKEYKFESDKIYLDASRAEARICETKYPILLVHGVFFRDTKLLNYWGRVPKELEYNGASIYYGNHSSALSVDESAEELAERIKDVLSKTGAEKVNIIAHSKGGLDARTTISKCGMDKYVASLTTINTPHRGCEFADYLLNKIPQAQQKQVAATYNKAACKLGDKNPDFIAAVTDLTFEACRKRNEEVLDSPNVYYQSFGSALKHPQSGRFPLNLSMRFVGAFDGPNDGLVGKDSFSWGEKYTFTESKGKRGISHGDVIDLNRENIPGFDVREFYVDIVSDLKNKGY